MDPQVCQKPETFYQRSHFSLAWIKNLLGQYYSFEEFRRSFQIVYSDEGINLIVFYLYPYLQILQTNYHGALQHRLRLKLPNEPIKICNYQKDLFIFWLNTEGKICGSMYNIAERITIELPSLDYQNPNNQEVKILFFTQKGIFSFVTNTKITYYLIQKVGSQLKIKKREHTLEKHDCIFQRNNLSGVSLLINPPRKQWIPSSKTIILKNLSFDGGNVLYLKDSIIQISLESMAPFNSNKFVQVLDIWEICPKKLYLKIRIQKGETSSKVSEKYADEHYIYSKQNMVIQKFELPIKCSFFNLQFCQNFRKIPDNSLNLKTLKLTDKQLSFLQSQIKYLVRLPVYALDYQNQAFEVLGQIVNEREKLFMCKQKHFSVSFEQENRYLQNVSVQEIELKLGLRDSKMISAFLMTSKVADCDEDLIQQIIELNRNEE